MLEIHVAPFKRNPKMKLNTHEMNIKVEDNSS